MGVDWLPSCIISRGGGGMEFPINPFLDLSTEPISANSLPAHSKRLMEIYYLFGFQQLIDKATRVTLTSKTLIDHIATTNKSNIVVSDLNEISLSDHFLVYCVRKFRGASKKQHKNISTRQMKNFSEEDYSGKACPHEKQKSS